MVIFSTKCILFDADGVVINSQMFSVQYQKEFNLPEGQMLPFFTNDFPASLIGQADLKEIVAPYLSDWKWSGTVDEFLQYWFEAEHHLDQVVIESINKLRARDINCFLVTNQEKYRIQYMKKEMGFDKLFDGIYSSAQIGHKKPAPEFFRYVLRDLEQKYYIHPSEVMYFDDTPVNIDQASRLGIDAYLYQNFDQYYSHISSLI